MAISIKQASRRRYMTKRECGSIDSEDGVPCCGRERRRRVVDGSRLLRARLCARRVEQAPVLFVLQQPRAERTAGAEELYVVQGEQLLSAAGDRGDVRAREAAAGRLAGLPALRQLSDVLHLRARSEPLLPGRAADRVRAVLRRVVRRLRAGRAQGLRHTRPVSERAPVLSESALQSGTDGRMLQLRRRAGHQRRAQANAATTCRRSRLGYLLCVSDADTVAVQCPMSTLNVLRCSGSRTLCSNRRRNDGDRLVIGRCD